MKLLSTSLIAFAIAIGSSSAAAMKEFQPCELCEKGYVRNVVLDRNTRDYMCMLCSQGRSQDMSTLDDYDVSFGAGPDPELGDYPTGYDSDDSVRKQQRRRRTSGCGGVTGCNMSAE